MFSLMKKAMASMSGNMAYAKVSKPIRGADSPALFEPSLMPFYVNEVDGAGAYAGAYSRTSPYIWQSIPQAVIASPLGASTGISSGNSAGHLVDPTYLLGALLGRGSQ